MGRTMTGLGIVVIPIVFPCQKKGKRVASLPARRATTYVLFDDTPHGGRYSQKTSRSRNCDDTAVSLQPVRSSLIRDEAAMPALMPIGQATAARRRINRKAVDLTGAL